MVFLLFALNFAMASESAQAEGLTAKYQRLRCDYGDGSTCSDYAYGLLENPTMSDLRKARLAAEHGCFEKRDKDSCDLIKSDAKSREGFLAACKDGDAKSCTTYAEGVLIIHDRKEEAIDYFQIACALSDKYSCDVLNLIGEHNRVALWYSPAVITKIQNICRSKNGGPACDYLKKNPPLPPMRKNASYVPRPVDLGRAQTPAVHQMELTITTADKSNDDFEGYELVPKPKEPDQNSELLSAVISELKVGQYVSFRSLANLGVRCTGARSGSGGWADFNCEQSVIKSHFYIQTTGGRLYSAQFYLLRGQFDQLFPGFRTNTDERDMTTQDLSEISSQSVRAMVREKCQIGQRCEAVWWLSGAAGFLILRKLVTRDVYVLNFMGRATLKNRERPKPNLKAQND